ncbi:hypothetical protein BRD17_02260 [Halobacteriales archaeon SW_7_68_16]|nr:MAG: hypothetical protein BRD17_02260 [Halobacteriales archaeon SW_7_68_16]
MKTTAVSDDDGGMTDDRVESRGDERRRGDGFDAPDPSGGSAVPRRASRRRWSSGERRERSGSRR